MGVKGLNAILRGKGKPVNLTEVATKAYEESGQKTPLRIACDGLALMHWLLKSTPAGLPVADCRYGGQHWALAEATAAFVNRLRAAHIELVVAFDGPSAPDKSDESIRRARQGVTSRMQLWRELWNTGDCSAYSSSELAPLLGASTFRAVLAEANVACHFCVAEADQFVAGLCRHEGCFAALSLDSDFFIHGVPYVPLDSLKVSSDAAAPIEAQIFVPKDTAEILGVDPLLLPLIAGLAGNDFFRGLVAPKPEATPEEPNVAAPPTAVAPASAPATPAAAPTTPTKKAAAAPAPAPAPAAAPAGVSMKKYKNSPAAIAAANAAALAAAPAAAAAAASAPKKPVNTLSAAIKYAKENAAELLKLVATPEELCKHVTKGDADAAEGLVTALSKYSPDNQDSAAVLATLKPELIDLFHKGVLRVAMSAALYQSVHSPIVVEDAAIGNPSLYRPLMPIADAVRPLNAAIYAVLLGSDVEIEESFQSRGRLEHSVTVTGNWPFEGVKEMTITEIRAAPVELRKQLLLQLFRVDPAKATAAAAVESPLAMIGLCLTSYIRSSGGADALTAVTSLAYLHERKEGKAFEKDGKGFSTSEKPHVAQGVHCFNLIQRVFGILADVNDLFSRPLGDLPSPHKLFDGASYLAALHRVRYKGLTAGAETAFVKAIAPEALVEVDNARKAKAAKERKDKDKAKAKAKKGDSKKGGPANAFDLLDDA